MLEHLSNVDEKLEEVPRKMLEEASGKMLTKNCLNIYCYERRWRKKCCNIFKNVETFLI
jgi:hypothetical protein